MKQDELKSQLVFSIGKKIEQTQETYEKEHADLLAMKNAFAMSVKCLEDYRVAMIKELTDAKLGIKEAEYGKIYVNRCIELISNLCLGAEQKRLRAEGAIESLKQTVQEIKKIHDAELDKETVQPIKSKKTS